MRRSALWGSSRTLRRYCQLKSATIEFVTSTRTNVGMGPPTVALCGGCAWPDVPSALAVESRGPVSVGRRLGRLGAVRRVPSSDWLMPAVVASDSADSSDGSSESESGSSTAFLLTPNVCKEASMAFAFKQWIENGQVNCLGALTLDKVDLH